MIPDMALMIVIYGSARLITAVLEPHRRASGTSGYVATGISWAVAAAAVGFLAVLGVAVIHSSASLADLTKP